MDGVFILGGVLVVLWLLAYTSRRRFGVLGLALAAGALLGLVWSGDVVGVVERSGFTTASISTAGMVSMALVLMPAGILLLSGPSYRTKKARAIGALLFAALATALIIEPLSSTLILNSESRTLFDTVVAYQAYIATVGVAVALLDILATHTISGGRSRKTRH